MRFNLKSLAYPLVVSCGLLAFPSLASAEVKPYPACERDPTDNDISAAKGAYEAGQVSYQEGDYERALLYWEDAFRRDCTAVKLLLNIAQAYVLAEDRKAAVNALQTYLDRRPDASDRGTIETRIAKLKERIEAEEKEAADAAQEAPASSGPVNETTSGAAAPGEAPTKAKKPAWPVWLTGGGVVVALLGHGSFAQGEILREEKAEDLGCDLTTNECPNDAARDEVNEAGARERRVGASLAVLGHLTGITGGVLWWILWTQDKKPDVAARSHRTMFQPVVAPGYQGLSFSGRF
jgi:tetratricopeptide (TPR) repeat protein